MQYNNLIMLALVVGLLLWVMFQQITTRRYSLGKLWIIPLALGIYTYVNFNPDLLNDPADMGLIIGALLIGGLAGLARGALNKVQLDRTSGQLVVYGSVLGLLYWLAFVAGEVALRFTINQGNFTSASPLGTVLPLALVTGFFAGWRAVWFMKYLQLNQMPY